MNQTQRVESLDSHGTQLTEDAKFQMSITNGSIKQPIKHSKTVSKMSESQLPSIIHDSDFPDQDKNNVVEITDSEEDDFKIADHPQKYIKLTINIVKLQEEFKKVNECYVQFDHHGKIYKTDVESKKGSKFTWN